jgi:alkanesulfonate monooxygenase SsuD/methylene tetrahydromethanopterin reductase-like flavin-dependent oxidoreductase (luciferase family)
VVRPSEFHLFLPQLRQTIDAVVARARAAEEAGFTGIAFMDHLAPPAAEDQPMFEAMMTAATIAGRTERLVVGHLVLCDAFRHPAVLARQAVTLDHASGGRFELGIGAGSVPAELDTFGVTPTDRRVARLAETLEVVTRLWTGEEVDFDGAFHHLRGARQLPVPSRPIPVVIGGSGPRMMDIVARYADWWNLPTNEATRLDELRPAAGRARTSLQQVVAFVPDEDHREEVTALAMRRFGRMAGAGPAVGTGPELVEHFRALQERGVERFYTWFADFAPPETLAAFGSGVIGAM